MVVGRRHFAKKSANAITRHEQNKKILSHATSVSNKLKQTEDKNTFVISNIVSVVPSPSKKVDITKFMQLRIYLNVVCQVHIIEKKASKKHGHLISQFHNTEVKWSIKPCIV